MPCSVTVAALRMRSVTSSPIIPYRMRSVSSTIFAPGPGSKRTSMSTGALTVFFALGVTMLMTGPSVARCDSGSSLPAAPLSTRLRASFSCWYSAVVSSSKLSAAVTSQQALNRATAMAIRAPASVVRVIVRSPHPFW
jgi:hypothetical protein